MGGNKIPANFGSSYGNINKKNTKQAKNDNGLKASLFNGGKGVGEVKTYYANLTPEKGSKGTKKVAPEIKTYYANLTPEKGSKETKKVAPEIKTYYANLTPEKGSKGTKKTTPDVKTYYANLTPDANNTNDKPKRTK